MRWLPEVVRGSQRFALPLCDASARLLVQALLTDSARARAEICLQAIAEDAALALWCLARASDVQELRTTRAIAEWLSAHLLSDLQWPESENDRPITADAQLSRFADLAASAVGTASLACQLVCERVEFNPDEVRLLGLLHGARRWLEQDAAVDATTTAADPFPEWLSNELAAIDRAKASERPQTAAAMVRQARDILSRKGRRKLPRSVDLELLVLQCESARERWLLSELSFFSLAALSKKLERLEQLESDFHRMLEFEKIESLKELAYGAGHEINNPLANISARAQTLLMEERDPERRKKLAAINTQAFRAHEMIADMMLFARPPQLRRERIDLVALARSVLDALQSQAAEQGTAVVLRTSDEPVIISADPAQLAVALRALCVNSLEALTRGGRMEIALDRTAVGGVNGSHGSQGELRIMVSDDGPGIPAEVGRHLFDPFYSGREAGRGLGFGLSKCWRIVTDHGGRIEVDGASGRGARFSLVFPEVAIASAVPS